MELKTTDYNHDNYITTPEFTKITAEIFDFILKQAHLLSKSDIANFVNGRDFDNKLKDVILNKNELNELSKKVKSNIIERINKRFDK